MGEVGFDGGGDEGEGVATLLTAGFDHRQHRLDEAAAGRTLRPERQLPPDHRMTQRTLARVVRRFDPFVIARTSTATGDARTIPGTCRARRRCCFAFRAAANAPPCGEPDPCDAPARPAKSCRRDNRPNARTTRTWPLADALQAISTADRPCRSSLGNRVSGAPSTIAGVPTCQYIFARSQVTTPWNFSVRKTPSAVASRVAAPRTP